MLKKRKYILGISFVICLFIFTGCSVRKNVKNKETKEFTKSILESNEKVKDLKFYFVRPYLGAEMVCNSDLDKEDFKSLIDEFKTLIDIDFMQRIGDDCWGGARPSEFNLYIYVNNKRENSYDYQVNSRYNKTHIHDENPDNIDGYKTWYIEDKNYNNITIEPKMDIKAEYSNGRIITTVDILDIENIENIVSTEFRYKAYFLDQYVDVKPWVHTVDTSGYKDKDTYYIREHFLQGKKDYIEIEVVIIYNDGKEELVENTTIQNIKEKIYNDFVIKPEIGEDEIYYHADGLTAIIHKESYDEEILFYSNPNDIHPNISVGFEKDYALYRLNSYEVISKPEAAERNYEGFTKIDFQKDSDVDDSYIIIEHGTIELDWEGFYPYDLDGNEVFYESKDGGLNMVRDGKMVEISDAAHEKHKQMKSKLPDVKIRLNIDEKIKVVDYYFEPNVSIIEGKLITRMYYGPPNYGENPDTDAQQHPFILQLDDPIDVIALEDDIYNSDRFQVTEIQVVPNNKEETELVKQYINKRITIQGTLFEAIFGGHHTDVLIKVDKILD